MSTRHIVSAGFEQEVVQSSLPTLVDFYADWCGPCRVMGPVVDELAEEVEAQANVVKVNVDESPDIAGQYDVSSIPTFIVLRDGVVTARFVGIQKKESLAAALAV